MCVCVFVYLFVCVQYMNVSCVCVWLHQRDGMYVLNLKDTSADPVHNREIFISCSRTARPMKGNYADIQP